MGQPPQKHARTDTHTHTHKQVSLYTHVAGIPHSSFTGQGLHECYISFSPILKNTHLQSHSKEHTLTAQSPQLHSQTGHIFERIQTYSPHQLFAKLNDNLKLTRMKVKPSKCWCVLFGQEWFLSCNSPMDAISAQSLSYCGIVNTDLNWGKWC